MMEVRDVLLKQRAAEVGATLELFVLTPGRRCSVAVDLASGALVRLYHNELTTPLAPYDIAVGSVVASDVEREHPESVDIGHGFRKVGSLNGRRADRILRALEHPKSTSIFGVRGPTVPVWELDGTRPSVGLVVPDDGPEIVRTESGYRCRFNWAGHLNDLPFEDRNVIEQLHWYPHASLYGKELRRVLGFRPELFVVALGRPKNGHCYKIVAGLLPRP